MTIRIIEKVKSLFKASDAGAAAELTPAQRIPRSEHNISRQAISENALKVLYRLKNAGYSAYLVGGSVRDILLGYHPKDFDVATNANPDQVQALFKNCRLIGKRFRLAHVYFKSDIIEVATFRAAAPSDNSPHQQRNANGMLIRDNIYGTLSEDVWRRDFTINALYYDISDFSIVDYVNGLADLQHKLIRMIGDPEQRLLEDPVRILRAIRLAAKLDLTIDPNLSAHFKPIGQHLAQISNARLFDESIKMLRSGSANQCLTLLLQYHLLDYLFPLATPYLKATDDRGTLIRQALISTDQRVQEGKKITPIFLLAALLWPVLQDKMIELEHSKIPRLRAFDIAADKVLKKQSERTSLPKFFQQGIKDIWYLQLMLSKITERQVWKCFAHPRFRAAYDFYLMRTEFGDADRQIAQFWTQFQEASNEQKQQLIKTAKQCGEGLSHEKTSASDND